MRTSGVGCAYVKLDLARVTESVGLLNERFILSQWSSCMPADEAFYVLIKLG